VLASNILDIGCQRDSSVTSSFWSQACGFRWLICQNLITYVSIKMKGEQTKKNHGVFTIIAYSIFYSRVWGSSVHDIFTSFVSGRNIPEDTAVSSLGGG